MYRLNPDCWVWSPRPPLCLIPRQQRRFTSNRPGNQEEEEEEEEEEVGDHSAVCCYSTGCDDIIAQAADAHWSTLELAAHSGIPSSSVLAGQGPQQPMTLLHAAGGDTAQHAIGGHCCQGPATEIQACVCVYGQRGAEGLGHCWAGGPYVYYGVRRNVVVGVEVVEEVAVEDTLEVITEDIYTDDLLDPDLLQDDQLYPT